jgi:hypothetical protein
VPRRYIRQQMCRFEHELFIYLHTYLHPARSQTQDLVKKASVVGSFP